MIDLLVINTATPGDGDQLFLDILPWLGLILLLVVILVLTIYIGRRLVRSDGDGSEQPFTLQSLRDLHASGALSDEEFQRARDAMIGRVKAENPSEAGSSENESADEAHSEPDDAGDSAEDRPARPDRADNKNGEKPKGDASD